VRLSLQNRGDGWAGNSDWRITCFWKMQMKGFSPTFTRLCFPRNMRRGDIHSTNSHGNNDHIGNGSRREFKFMFRIGFSHIDVIAQIHMITGAVDCISIYAYISTHAQSCNLWDEQVILTNCSMGCSLAKYHRPGDREGVFCWNVDGRMKHDTVW
jgi:hypothetical protein